MLFLAEVNLSIRCISSTLFSLGTYIVGTAFFNCYTLFETGYYCICWFSLWDMGCLELISTPLIYCSFYNSKLLTLFGPFELSISFSNSSLSLRVPLALWILILSFPIYICYGLVTCCLTFICWCYYFPLIRNWFILPSRVL